MELKRDKSFFDQFLNILGVLTAIIIIFIMFVVIFEVGRRYFFHKPTYWVMQVVEWCLVWMTFLSVAYVLKEERHVSMDILVSRLSPKNQALLGVFTSIAGAVICLILAWYGAQIVQDHIVRNVLEPKLIRAPKGPLMSIIPAGFFLLFIQFIRRTANFFKQWKSF
mgnify:FL=1